MKNILTVLILLFICALSSAQESPLVGEWIGSWNFEGWNSHKGTGKTIIRITKDGELLDVRIKEVYGDDYGKTYYWPDIHPVLKAKNVIEFKIKTSTGVLAAGDRFRVDSFYTFRLENNGLILLLTNPYNYWETRDIKTDTIVESGSSPASVVHTGMRTRYDYLSELRLYRKGDEW